jgi:hypothetical protein
VPGLGRLFDGSRTRAGSRASEWTLGRRELLSRKRWGRRGLNRLLEQCGEGRDLLV